MKRLLVTVDSLRYDHYQYMTNTRECLGESHPNAFATATATLGTFPNIFTGTYTKSNEIRESFVEEFDVETVGITTNRLVSERYGYNVGFDRFSSPASTTEADLKERVAESLPSGIIYESVSRLYSLYQGILPGSIAKSFRPANDVIAELQSVTAENSDWFAWIHLMEPHHPYDPNKADLSRKEAQALSRRAIANGVSGAEAETVRDLYRQEVVELDEQLKILWDWLPDDCQVIFTGDHGEMLGEDGQWGHPGILRWETLHVPFVTNWETQCGPVISSIDIPSLFLNECYGEGSLERHTAFASHGRKSAAIKPRVISTPEGTFDRNFQTTNDERLEEMKSKFEPSGIVKEDALIEDLEDLGYA